MNMFAQAGSVGVVLLLLVAGIFVLAWLARRLRVLPSIDSAIKVLNVVPIGHRDRLVMLEWENRRLLLGVTAQGIEKLDARDLTAEEIDASLNQPTTEASAQLDAAGGINSLVRKLLAGQSQ